MVRISPHVVLVTAIMACVSASVVTHVRGRLVFITFEQAFGITVSSILVVFLSGTGQGKRVMPYGKGGTTVMAAMAKVSDKDGIGLKEKGIG